MTGGPGNFPIFEPLIRLSLPGILAAALASCTFLNLQGEDQYVGQDPAVAFDKTQVIDQAPMQVDEDHPTADWGLTLVWEGDHYLVSADRNVTPGGLTQVFQVRAVTDIPMLKRGQMVALGTCRESGRPISRVTAVVQYDPAQEWFTNIPAAWAYDPKQDGFVSYPTQDLQCKNQLFGVDLTPPPLTSLLPSLAVPPR